MERDNIEEGESSDKTYKSDNSSGRPLRKARYLWQIKGKYHMKNSENEASKLFVADENKDRNCSPTEMLESCASQCLKDPAPTIQEENNNGAQSEEANTALSESEADEPMDIAEIIRQGSVPVPESLLKKWQANQVAYCYFDNTINGVMDGSRFLPSPQDKERLLEHFKRRRTESRMLENRAVMMAIHSHGLQRNVLGMLPSGSAYCAVGERMNYYYKHSLNVLNSSRFQNEIANNITNSGSESFTEDSKDHVYVTKEQDSSSVSDSGISCKSVGSENVALQSVHLSLPNKLASVEDESVSIMEHTDFMDKAVAVAIQKKGLSAFSNMELN